MTVYVDDTYIQATVPNGKASHSSRWCHLMGDSLEDLLAFAESLGLKQEYLQDKRTGVHFDLTEAKRRQAVAKGAVEIQVGSEEWLRVVSKARSQWTGHRD